jgi:arylsulfatase A-like enzyme
MQKKKRSPGVTRRAFLADACALSASFAIGGPAHAAAEALGTGGGESPRRTGKTPNILFVFSDQQRWDTLGCYGQKMDITPNLDRMAGEGVRFENSFTCQPVCGPARAALQTGRYPTEVGCHTNGRMLPLDQKTLAHYLSEVGYEVGYIGKWHLASGPGAYESAAVPPERRGGYKDFWLASDVLEFTSHSYDGHMFNGKMERVDFPPDRYRVDCLTDFAIDYLKTRTREKPFFLFLSYIEPHFQNDSDHFEGPTGSKTKNKDFEIPGDLAGTGGNWREEYPDYLGCCESLDAGLGRLRESLARLGLAEDTLIVYTSDHACHFRTRNGEYKRSCHDNSIRTPLLVYRPGFKGGKVIQDLVSLIDLPPTLLAAAGREVPGAMRGRPLQELAAGTAADWPADVFIQISEDIIGRAVRTKRWKYSVVATKAAKGPQPPGSDLYREHYLYDLEKDPHERNNLVRDPALASIRADLAAVLKHRMVAAGEKAPVIDPAA